MKRHFSILSHFQNVFQRSQGSDQGRRISATGNNSPSNPNSILWDNLSREDKSLALQVQSSRLFPSSPWCIYRRVLEASDYACKSLQVALKTADIGHLATEPKLHKRWALALEEEFFQQVGRQAGSCLISLLQSVIHHEPPAGGQREGQLHASLPAYGQAAERQGRDNSVTGIAHRKFFLGCVTAAPAYFGGAGFRSASTTSWPFRCSKASLMFLRTVNLF